MLKNIFIANLLLITCVISAYADPAGSTSYSIRWDSLDTAGSKSSSGNYQLSDSIKQFSDISSSLNFIVISGFQSVPDSDSDGHINIHDNCMFVPNVNQINGNSGTATGQDIYGNKCDADLDESGFVNFADLALLKAAFGRVDAEANIDGRGLVNFADLAAFKSMFGSRPGPSGLYESP
jgi:hypothetical protein